MAKVDPSVRLKDRVPVVCTVTPAKNAVRMEQIANVESGNLRGGGSCFSYRDICQLTKKLNEVSTNIDISEEKK